MTPPPHGPELGRMSRLLGRFHVTGVFWFRFHRWGVSILPEWGVWLITLLFTSFFFVVLRRIRRMALDVGQEAAAELLPVALDGPAWHQITARIHRLLDTRIHPGDGGSEHRGPQRTGLLRPVDT